MTMDKSTKETLESVFGKGGYEWFAKFYQTTVKEIKEGTSRTKKPKNIKKNK